MNDHQDHDAFAAQLVAVQRRLYAYILTGLPNLEDADDVLQETNAVLLRNRESFTPGTEFGAWACRVAYFQILAYRKRQQRERGRLLFADEDLLQSMASETSAQWANREELLLARLEQCISKVSASNRELLRFRNRSRILRNWYCAIGGHGL